MLNKLFYECYQTKRSEKRRRMCERKKETKMEKKIITTKYFLFFLTANLSFVL